MFTKFKYTCIRFLKSLLGKLQSKQNEFDRLDRVQAVHDFLHATMPAYDSTWSNKAICEGSRWNYFELPSGAYPYYDFVLPEIPLYVCVPGIVSASWAEARERGISRELWETAQADLVAIEELTISLPTINMAAEPKVLVIRWDEPINHLYLIRRLQGVMSKK